MHVHARREPVHEQARVLPEHPVGELADLPGAFVEVPGVTGQRAHLRERGHAHVQIVEPQRARQWPVPRQGTVRQPELLRHDVVDVVVDDGTQVARHARARGLDHRRAHRSGIVEGTGLEHRVQGPTLARMRRQPRAIDRGEVGNQLHARGHVLAKRPVSRGLRGEHHPRVGDAPLVADHAEGAGLEDRVGVDPRGVGDGLPARLVHQPCGRVGVEVRPDAFEHLGHLRHTRRPVRHRVVRLQEVQRRVGVRGHRGGGLGEDALGHEADPDHHRHHATTGDARCSLTDRAHQSSSGRGPHPRIRSTWLEFRSSSSVPDDRVPASENRAPLSTTRRTRMSQPRGA